MIPVIALAGRKNVGKSTLFNCLTRTRNALVADFPGLTCDRQYGYVEIENQKFICIDVGGIDCVENKIKSCTNKQSLLAIEEADIVLFVVDARSGLMPIDLEIAKYLRTREKLTFLIANKTDNININQVIADFCPLGFTEIYPIIASHNYGITSLLEDILLPFGKNINLRKVQYENIENLVNFKEKKIRKKESKKDFSTKCFPIKLAIVGCPNVGKSMLTNCILGEDRMVVCDIPGTTRDSIYIPVKRDMYEYVLIDTAGIRKRRKNYNLIEGLSIVKSLQAIEDADVVLLVIDAVKGVVDQDRSLLSFIVSNGRPLVIVINKWDSITCKEKKQKKEILNFRLSFVSFARIHYVSALYGEGIDNIFKSIHETYNSSIRRVSTAMLTHIMNMAVEKRFPPLVGGSYRCIKLKYAHIGGYNPIVIVIHGNKVTNLPNFYKRYLTNYFRKHLNIIGIPIRIQCNENYNPYVNVRNPSTRSSNQRI